MKTKRNYLLSFLLITAAIATLLFTWSCEKEDPVNPATLSTLSVNSITINTAQSGGNITSDGGGDITSRGVVWSTSSNPTVEQNNWITMDGSGLGLYQSNITNLQPNTTYYVRAYANNEAGMVYGNEQQFTTLGELATITTANVTDISATASTSGGNITDDGGAEVTVRGVCWNTEPNPSVDNWKTTDGGGIGNFTSNLTDLLPNTTYYVKAYSTSSIGTSYGNEVEFTTQSELPTVTTSSITKITQNSATGGGNVTDDGGAEVTARGVCWNTEPNPSVDNWKTTDGGDMGSFTSNLTDLSTNTTYYVRAYSTNSIGTSYGNEMEFTTLAKLPTVTTSSVTNITENSATARGNVTDDGGVEVTERGIAYSTSQNPTTSDNTVTAGSGTGSFSADITGLVPNTTYYVRAFATNSQGIAYGNQIEFAKVVEVTNHTTGKVWLDRNLGAIRAATYSTDRVAYGHLYQWGRATDGHQIRTSGTTSTLSSSDTPGHSNFILTSEIPNDWRNPQNDNLWLEVNGVNNPCPVDFRLPTEAEWEAERQSWWSNDIVGAMHFLKLPYGGYRSSNSGSLHAVGYSGRYWSGTVDGTRTRYLFFNSVSAGHSSSGRARGHSVRCIKD